MKIDHLSRAVMERVAAFAGFAGRMFYFWAETMSKCVTPEFYFSETVKQMYTIGVKSLLLTSTAALSVGIVLAMQTIGTLFLSVSGSSAPGIRRHYIFRSNWKRRPVPRPYPLRISIQQERESNSKRGGAGLAGYHYAICHCAFAAGQQPT